MNLNQYKELCNSCDKILNVASESDEIVSIPILHVLREHPECLEKYESVFNKSFKNESKSKHLFKKTIDLVKSCLFDSKINNLNANFALKSSKLIIVSHITNENQCSDIHDEYFGSLHNDLKSFSDIEPIVLLINQTSISSKKLSKKLSKNNINKTVLPKSAGLINEIKILYRLILSLFFFTKKNQFKGPIELSLIKLITRPSNLLSAMTVLRIGFFVEKITKICNPKYILTTYEGHSRERIIFSSARKINKDILCYAYQHSILNKYQHALTRGIHSKYNPDHIFCCGEITRDILKKSNSLNNVGISTLGSSKGLPINNISNTPLKKNQLTFLFLPEGSEPEYKIFFKFILECAQVFPDSNFTWRSHPILSLEKLDIFNEETLPSNVTISNNVFDKDLIDSDIAIYRGSTAIIRAVMGNLVPIYLQKNSEIGIDIMYSINVHRVYLPSELKLIVQSSNFNLHTEEAIKFCQNYFQPMNYKSIMDVIDKNGF